MTLIAALLAALAAYGLFVFLVPKAIPDEKSTNLKSALNRLYEENRANESVGDRTLEDELQEESPLMRSIFGLSFMKNLHSLALQAGYQNNLKQLFMIMVIAMAAFFIAMIAAGMVLIGFLGAVPFGYLYAVRRCKKVVRKRNRKFIDQFPDALDMIVRSVRSGFPLSTALQMLSDNAEEPVREEFRKVSDDIALGRSLPQALARMALRINESDTRFFVVVLSVQQETGGNLSEIIGNLSSVIRKRKQLRHRIRALTSEGVATGWILGALPVFVFAILYTVQRDYLRPFWTDSLGETIFGGVIGMLILCFFVVRAMINIDI